MDHLQSPCVVFLQEKIIQMKTKAIFWAYL